MTIINLDDIEREVIAYYQTLYAETESWRPEFNKMHGSSIREEEREWMQRDFEEQEVVESLKLCEADKMDTT